MKAFIQMFSGIDGFKLGLERSGWKCVWSNDNDKYACKVSRKNYPNGVLIEADIKTINADSIPNHTLLTAGFPCQAFSVAGKRKGFQDTRGTLFHEICRIAKAKQPPLLLLENVKGLLSHDKGLTFQIILESLEKLGYLCEWQVLNSKHFGVPQNRERVFIIGHLREKSSKQIFPIGEVYSIPSKKNRGKQEAEERIQSSIASTIDARYGALRNAGETYITQALEASYSKTKSFTNMLMVHNIYGGFKEGMRVSDKVSPTLRTPKGGGHLPVVAQLVGDRDNPSVSVKNEAFCLPSNPMSDRQQAVIVADRSRSYANKGRNLESPKKETNALSSVQKDNLLFRDCRIRRLTPIECERLQGFPDGWTRGVSDTQRYKLLGNAVTVNVIEFLGKALVTA